MRMQQNNTFPRKMVWLSFTSLSLIYTIMLIGVYITASDQGLSCPDWPLCPNGFGLPEPKYFFEHIHRMLVLVTSGFIFATAFYAFKKAKPVQKTAIIASILVIIQMILGMILVNSKLQPILVASHLATGMTLFAMLLLTFIYSYRESNRTIKI